MLYEALQLIPVQVCHSFVKSMGVERIDVLPQRLLQQRVFFDADPKYTILLLR